MNNLILSCQNLEKTYQKHPILTNVNIEVNSGEIVGFIGENGAGKSTTLKIILGLIKPDKGKVYICGHDLNKNFVAAIKNVGAIIETPSFYANLTGRQNLYLAQNSKRVKTDKIINLLNLKNFIDQKVQKYSLGMKQKLALAMALINEPKLLILDEPTNGLDPKGIKDLKNIILKLVKNYHIGVLISSHNLKELEDFCDEIYLLNKGITTPISLKKNLYYLIKCNNPNQVKETKYFKKEKSFLKTYELDRTLKYLTQHKIKITSIKQVKPSLEDTFFNSLGGHNE